MRGLQAAVRSGNSALVLDCFSRNQRWTYISDDPDTRQGHKMRFSYQDLLKGIERGGNLHDIFFDEDRELNRHAEPTQGWVDVGGSLFVPQHDPGSPSIEGTTVRVKWRKEGSRFVVDSIFETGS